MKYILFLSTLVILISCTPTKQPLSIYSLNPTNTVFVRETGDAGANIKYYNTQPRHEGEDKLKTKGFALDIKLVPFNSFFVESSYGKINEYSNRNVISASRNYDSFFSENYSTFNNFEFGLGKIFPLFQNKNFGFQLSSGFRKTVFTSDFILLENGKEINAKLFFKNDNIYLNPSINFQKNNFLYQGGLKIEFTNYKNINTDNPNYYSEKILLLQNLYSKYRMVAQMYHDFGVSPFKNEKSLSIHFGFGQGLGFSKENGFAFRNSNTSFSIMYTGKIF